MFALFIQDQVNYFISCGGYSGLFGLQSFIRSCNLLQPQAAQAVSQRDHITERSCF